MALDNYSTRHNQQYINMYLQNAQVRWAAIISVLALLACRRSFPTIQCTPSCAVHAWRSIQGIQPSQWGANSPAPSQGAPLHVHEQHHQENLQLWDKHF